MLVVAQSSSGAGLRRRLNRIFRGNRVVIVPLDGLLIDGDIPQPNETTAAIVEGAPDAVLGFAGFFRSMDSVLGPTTGILNLTASTINNAPNRKQRIDELETALRLGLDGVAVHVNVGDEWEQSMLESLASVGRAADGYGVPLFAIMYPRRTKESDIELRADPNQYADRVAHAVRVGIELGAHVVKTQYTGSVKTFKRVIEVAGPTPVVVAGGPSGEVCDTLRIAREAVDAGAAGVCFGRRVYKHPSPSRMVRALKAIVHCGASPSEVAGELGHVMGGSGD